MSGWTEKPKAELTFEEIRDRYESGKYTSMIGLDPGAKLVFGVVRENQETEASVNVKVRSNHYRHERGDNVRKQQRLVLTNHFDEKLQSTISPHDHEAYSEDRICYFNPKQKVCSRPR